jgi:hypothetical protein
MMPNRIATFFPIPTSEAWAIQIRIRIRIQKAAITTRDLTIILTITTHKEPPTMTIDHHLITEITEITEAVVMLIEVTITTDKTTTTTMVIDIIDTIKIKIQIQIRVPIEIQIQQKAIIKIKNPPLFLRRLLLLLPPPKRIPFPLRPENGFEIFNSLFFVIFMQNSVFFFFLKENGFAAQFFVW